MIIIAYRPGQLANRLMLLSNFIAYSEASKVKILDPSFGFYARWFVGPNQQAIPKFPFKKSSRSTSINIEFRFKVFFFAGRVIDRLRIKSKYLSCTYLDWDQRFNLDDHKEFGRRGLHFVQGWKFRSPNNMLKYSDVVRRYFDLAEPYKTKLASYLRTYISLSKLNVGIHIRHGDYIDFEGGKYFYQESIYAGYMSQVQELFESQVNFIICTNSSTLDMTKFEDFDVVLGPGHPAQDLYALAACDYIIGPPSTFSMWASFYGKAPLYQIVNDSDSLSLEHFRINLGV